LARVEVFGFHAVMEPFPLAVDCQKGPVYRVGRFIAQSCDVWPLLAPFLGIKLILLQPQRPHRKGKELEIVSLQRAAHNGTQVPQKETQ